MELLVQAESKEANERLQTENKHFLKQIEEMQAENRDLNERMQHKDEQYQKQIEEYDSFGRI